MKTFCVFVLFLLQAAIGYGWTANTGTFSPRMFGSHDVTNGQFPYVTFHLIRTGGGYDVCTGSLIGRVWILFAAHCVKQGVEPKNHVVAAGNANMAVYMSARRKMAIWQDIDENKYDLQERRAAATYKHPNYTGPGAHDIGLVRVIRSFVFNNRVNSIPWSSSPFKPQNDCTLVGYGAVENNIVRYQLQYISHMPAKPAEFCTFRKFVDAICLKDTKRGICFGDSGGPLVCGEKLVGVASHGISTSRICGQGVQEQYFINTAVNAEWIKSVRRSYSAAKTKNKQN